MKCARASAAAPTARSAAITPAMTGAVRSASSARRGHGGRPSLATRKRSYCTETMSGAPLRRSRGTSRRGAAAPARRRTLRPSRTPRPSRTSSPASSSGPPVGPGNVGAQPRHECQAGSDQSPDGCDRDPAPRGESGPSRFPPVSSVRRGKSRPNGTDVPSLARSDKRDRTWREAVAAGTKSCPRSPNKQLEEESAMSAKSTHLMRTAGFAAAPLYRARRRCGCTSA